MELTAELCVRFHLCFLYSINRRERKPSKILLLVHTFFSTCVNLYSVSAIGSATCDNFSFSSSLAKCKIFNHAVNVSQTLFYKQCSEVHHLPHCYGLKKVCKLPTRSARDSLCAAILPSWSHGWRTNRKFPLIRSMSG